MRWFRSRLHDPEQVTRALVEALAERVGRHAVHVRFARLPKGGGAVHGTVDVADRDSFASCLRAVAEVLGDDGGRVVVYLTGTTPDGAVVQPADLGLHPRPNGSQIRAGLG